MRRLIADECPPLQASVVGFEQQGLVTPAQVDAGHVERHSRTHTGAALRLRRQAGLAAGLHLQSDSVTEGPALGFFQLEDDIFFRRHAFGILHRHIHFIE